jgi:PAS domain S-box-containing protein
MNTLTAPHVTAPAILIVDDTPANVGVLAEYLGSRGFLVMVAQDGEEGVERAQFVQPDLILLDVMMPGIGGFEACRRLKASDSTKDIPVIFMTALSDTSDKITGYSVGGVDYVTKPFQIEEVLARVNTHLALQAMRQQLTAKNLQLQHEIGVRQQAEAALQHAYDGLEEKVTQRTIELAQANASLKAKNIERKRVEETLREREARIHRLVESNIIGVFFWDLQGDISEANDAMLHIVGYSRDDVRAGTIKWTEMTPPEYRAVDMQAIDELRQTGKTTQYEKEFIRKDGTRVPVLLGAALFEGSQETGLAFVLDLTERKQAEEALRKSEEQWRNVFENNPTMYFMIDAAGTVISVNPYGAEQLGYTVGELIGHSVLNVFYEADKESALMQVARCLEQLGRTMSWEIRKVRKDGTMLWVRETARAVLREKCHPIVLIACEDITERREAQDKLQRSEAFLAEGQRMSHTGSWCWNIPTGKLIWSEEHCRIFGFDPAKAEPTFQLFGERLYPEDRSFVQNILDNAIRERCDFDCEYRIALPDGSIKYVQGMGRPILKESGDIENFIGTTMDITARKQGEEELREREARIRRLVDSNIIGVFFWDLRDEISEVNDALLQITGYTRQDLLSQHVNWVEMMPPEYGDADARALEELRQTGRITPYEKEFIRKDGSHVPVLIGAALFEGSRENGVGFVLDLTQRKRAEEALRQAHDVLEKRVLERTGELKESNQRLSLEVVERKRAEAVLAQRSQELARSNAELELMAYVASHDLQEPLRMVASYMQLLEKRYKDSLDADARDFIGFAVDGAKRMQALIDDLLTYSRVGTITISLQPVDCMTVVKKVINSIRVAMDESGARITCDPLPTVMGDATQLAQLFQNLIANAIKFRGDQAPQVHIYAESDENCWRFSVQDNGIGISPEYFDRIFVMFQRLHSRSTYPGTGIGLAICKKIVERHGGRIWVESSPQQGSIFKFTLPREKGNAP